MSSSSSIQLQGSSRYMRMQELGEGRFGVVFQAKDRVTGGTFAIKRMKNIGSGIDITAIRELKCLRELKSPNIITLVDVYSADGLLHMVLELCEATLDDIIREKKIFLTSGYIKSYMHMALSGVAHMHSSFVLHRDLKPENLLIGEGGRVKIADFGLAMFEGTPRPLTAKVVTSWYKCPELCYGARFYSAAIDMWSMGCIFGELMLRTPMFRGMDDSDIDQLAKIYNVLGTPNADTWKGANLLPNYVEFEHRDPVDLSELLRFNQPEAKDLLLKMLVFNPQDRINAIDSLNHAYFKSGIAATDPLELPRRRDGIWMTSGSSDDADNVAKRIKG